MIRGIWNHMRHFFNPLPRTPPPPGPAGTDIPPTPIENRAAFMTAINEESRSQLYRDWEQILSAKRGRR